MKKEFNFLTNSMQYLSNFTPTQINDIIHKRNLDKLNFMPTAEKTMVGGSIESGIARSTTHKLSKLASMVR